MDNAEIERIRPLVADLVMIGFFRLSGIETTLSEAELVEIADAEADGSLIAVDDGWYVTDWKDTLATQTFERIAGVASDVVPCSDVVAALMKAVAYGPAKARADVRRSRRHVWVQAYESLPTQAVIRAIADIVGANLVSEGGSVNVDFADVANPERPTEREQSVIYALEESPHGAMSVSRLCRRIDGGVRRATAYARIDTMPFILKDHTKAARLIGADGHPEGYKAETSFFVGMRWSSCGTRVLVHLRANEECIESNSCNIPAEARAQIEGTYVDVSTGIAIRCEHHEGRDNRKILGFTEIVHTLFDDYYSKDNIYLLLDRKTGEARLEVVSLHAAEKMAAIERMLEEGIRAGSLTGMFAEPMSMAA